MILVAALKAKAALKATNAASEITATVASGVETCNKRSIVVVNKTVVIMIFIVTSTLSIASKNVKQPIPMNSRIFGTTRISR